MSFEKPIALRIFIVVCHYKDELLHEQLNRIEVKPLTDLDILNLKVTSKRHYDLRELEHVKNEKNSLLDGMKSH